MKIALMITCLGDVLRPSTGRAVVQLLRRLGHEVEFPAAQTCCGQPMFNSGLRDLACQQARHTIRVFESCEAVVTPSGSCAAMVKVEYPHLFQEDAEFHGRALSLAKKVYEFSDFLVNRLQVVDVGAKYDGRVAYHFACHLRLLNQSNEVQQLVDHVDGASFVPLPRADQCCGFGGSFAVRYPEISGSLVTDKAHQFLSTNADLLVSTDAGCLMNIGGRLRRLNSTVPVLHIAELLAGHV